LLKKSKTFESSKVIKQEKVEASVETPVEPEAPATEAPATEAAE
jgi:hypothetical protein